MDEEDRKLLNLLQEAFPVCSRPFFSIGEALGMEESEVLERIGKMKQNGYIRRISGMFNPRELGYVSTLCAMKVPEERVEEVAQIINGYAGVTHNYVRRHRYNLWFTLIEPSTERIEEVLREIQEKTGIDNLLNLPSKKVYKIKANFNMTE